LSLAIALGKCEDNDLTEEEIARWTAEVRAEVSSEEIFGDSSNTKILIARNIKYCPWPEKSEILLDMMKDFDPTVKTEAGKALNYTASVIE